MAKRLFLSYRRSDTAAYAIPLKLMLESQLPGTSVFVDTESIIPGETWPDRLRATLADSVAMIALIGEHWRFGQDGVDRFQDSNDWVVRELSYGLENLQGKLFPVILGDTAHSNFDNLPAQLRPLPNIQAMPLVPTSFPRDVGQIAVAVAKTIGEQQIGGEIRYPTPNELKTLTPKIGQAEFEDHKSKSNALEGWVFRSTNVSTPAEVVSGSEIQKSFLFKNFKRAFNFMGQLAKWAETREHHPQWANTWNRVDVQLRTFDADQSVTWYDIEMASQMNKIADKVAAMERPDWPPFPSD